MLAVILIVLLFVLLALGVVFIAMRSGRRAAGAIRTESRGARLTLWLGLAVAYLGIGVALPLVLLIGNHANASAQVGGIALTNGEKMGREQFGEHCGVCHTLAAANAAGKVGPNLDELKPSQQLVLHTIENGCLQVPSTRASSETCLGYGVMPANVVQGRSAREVAEFVAKVAGQE